MSRAASYTTSPAARTANGTISTRAAAASVQPATRSVGRQPYRPPTPGAPPQPVGVPQPRSAVDCGEDGADRADAVAGDQIDLHPGFRKRTEHAGVVRAVGAGAAEDDGRAEFWRIGRRSGSRFGHGHARPGRAGVERAAVTSVHVVDGDEARDLERAPAAGRLHDHLVAFFLVDDRLADRRRRPR